MCFVSIQLYHRRITRRRTLHEMREASTVAVLGDETLRAIAQELVQRVRSNVTIDWSVKANVRARMQVLVKRIFKKHGYSPAKQEQATQMVLQQAQVLCKSWAA